MDQQVQDGTFLASGGSGQEAKKISARKNSWGSQSYADLITQAISSSPEKKLTLSEIYEWIIENFEYFKDRSDSKSSAGWKVRLHKNPHAH